MEEHGGAQGIQPGFTKPGKGQADIPGYSPDAGSEGIKGHAAISMQLLICLEEGFLGTIAAIVPASHRGGDGEA
jgi:hypothetical protein